ncbi:hypothetical protein GW813_12570, partial [bacterium]|nr:hypothetical protein [bacterium]
MGRFVIPLTLLTALWWPRTGLSAAQPDPLADLKQLFKDDPATAFEKAWKLFQEPRKKGDLDGMMGIIRVVTDMSVRCKYAKVLDEMADV